DFLTVALMVRGAPSIPDNWLYIHEPRVKVGRVQNYRAWSEAMVPDADIACYGLEYFCFEGDGLWTSTDAELIQLGTDELRQIGLLGVGEVVDGCVVRQRRAYPVYDSVYTQHIHVIKAALRAYPRLQIIGRNGMHKYNNQDHSMMTALLAAKNIIEDQTIFDVWAVNQDAEYHEETTGASGERFVPQRTV
ncbi:MAG: FAD-dependent oxidoreductase, partial [Gemmatimonadaceae bacterium]|nr:FAD-dependent oxidoreductase [Gemmatimonadaceae bacterium]